MTLHREVLRPAAAALFDVLAAAPEMEGLTLMGGTALALQIGHRISLDFDFAVFGGALPCQRIDTLIARLKAEGHKAMLVTDPDQISRFKINTGKKLLDFARDYAVDGVKVTFFSHGRSDRQQSYYRAAPKLREPGCRFEILGIEGMKTAKTLVLGDRVRSRDLYDLHVLMRDHGYSLGEMVGIVRELGTIDDPEHYKAVLRGKIPLDDDDEGLEPVEIGLTTEALYRFFGEKFDTYEVEQARRFFSQNRP